ncbi:unnamed protein product [Adineta steineri]|uniref:MD-2-related lipid-recognition domain-containing protein n=1 Tax=Adineta steineri TaxID=433720 RepID=A0A818WGU3_9BILA|nr:unnamed protein product [Adineta steineri]CAF1413965.1 unnamed protein product [Adineta steineri]CAF3724641.1 unnamed protein product [Adineta steineri]
MYTVQMNDVDLNCLKDSKKLSSFSIRVLSFNIWNDQLSIPGILDLSLSINVTKKLSANIQFSTKVERKFGLAWIDLPCLAGIGACDKQSLCDLIKQACKTNGFIRKNNQNTKTSCSCDLDIGIYTIEHVPINIKRKKSAKLVKPVTTGQYRFKVKFFETKSKTTVGCVTGYLTLLKPKI